MCSVPLIPNTTAGRYLCYLAAVIFVPFVVSPVFVMASETQANEDCRLSLQARQAMLRDADLESFNLGVSVNRRVATVWGAVPTKRLAARAVATVRNVQGIAAVVDQICIEAPLHMPVPRREFRPPAGGFDHKDRVPPAPQPKLQPPLPEYATKPSVPRLGTTVALPGPIGGNSTSRHEAKPAKPEKPAPTAQPTPKTSAAEQSLNAAIDNLCHSSPRYRHLRAQVADGVVRLQGTVVRGEDLFALAQSIGRLSGVTRVIVDGVRIDPLLAIGRD